MTISSITPREAARLIETGEALLIDVREPNEFIAGHIASAASIPLSVLPGFFAGGAMPAKPLIMQCQRGMRGEKACALLQSLGHDHQIYNMEGGIEAWQSANLPVIGSGKPAGISIFRQVQIVVGGLVAFGVTLGFFGYPAGFAAAGFFGAMLAIAGISGWCGLALLLDKMPWNRPAAKA